MSFLKSPGKEIFLFILFSLITLCCNRFIDQYQDVGQQLLSNADFSAGMSAWYTAGSVDTAVTIIDKKISLRSPATDGSVSIYQKITVPMGGKKVRLRALVQTDGVVAGEKSWNKARLLLIQYFDGEARWHLPHAIVALEGTRDRQEVSSTFTIASDCIDFRVMVQMNHCSGEFFLENISLYEVEETSLYCWVKWLIRGGWIVFIVVLFVPYLRNGKIVALKLLMFITVTAILVGTTMSGTVKDGLMGRIEAEFAGEVGGRHVAATPAKNGFSQPGWWRTAVKEIDFTKVAHFVLFMLLVVFLRYKNPGRPVKLIMLDIFMLACATELSQLFVENRSPLFTDVLIDMAGGGAGLFFFRRNRVYKVTGLEEKDMSVD